MLWLSSPFQNLLPPPLCFHVKSKQLNPGGMPHTRLILSTTLAHKAAWYPQRPSNGQLALILPYNGLFADQQPETLIPSLLFALKEHSWWWSNRYNVSFSSRPTHPDYSPPFSGIVCTSDFLKGEILPPPNCNTSHPLALSTAG